MAREGESGWSWRLQGVKLEWQVALAVGKSISRALAEAPFTDAEALVMMEWHRETWARAEELRRVLVGEAAGGGRS